jgi:hypothetical protein
VVKLRRRALLGGLGLGLGALSLPSLLPRGARAGSDAPVRRLLIVMTEHGAVYERWRLRPGGLPDDKDWELPLAGLAEAEFSEILRPLYGWRDRLLVLDGIASATGLLSGLNQHEVGHATALTGTLALEVQGSLARPQGPSIDQIVAEAIAEPGQIASLQLSQGSFPFCFDAVGKALPYIMEPLELYGRLFPEGPGDLPVSTDVAAIRERQSRVTGLVREQYAAVAPRLGADDRLKVEQHRDLLAALSLQLDKLADKACPEVQPPGAGPDWEDPAWYDFRSQMFRTLTTLALSCDLTRVAVIGLWGLRNSHVDAPPGDIHNDWAHAVALDPVAEQVMVNYGRHHAQEFAQLLAALHEVPSAGGTLLDDTLVVWSNELGTADHAMSAVPVVLAGGSSFFTPGRCIRWRPSHLVSGPWDDEWQGPPHNRLLVSIARALGLQIDRGGVDSLPLNEGPPLDCTGELDRLR